MGYDPRHPPRARNEPVALWCRTEESAARLAADRRNELRLPGVDFSPGVRPTADPAALADADLVIVAVPSAYVREVMGIVGPSISPVADVLSVVKGLERGTLLRMSEVIADAAAIEPARIGPDRAAIRAGSIPAASAMTSLIRRSVPRSRPFTTDRTSATGLMDGPTMPITSRTYADGTATMTRSASARAAGSAVGRTPGEKSTPGSRSSSRRSAARRAALSSVRHHSATGSFRPGGAPGSYPRAGAHDCDAGGPARGSGAPFGGLGHGVRRSRSADGRIPRVKPGFGPDFLPVPPSRFVAGLIADGSMRVRR